MKEACSILDLNNRRVDLEKSANTITLEYGLYCEENWKIGFLGTSMMVVGVLSVLGMGFLSNSLGRKEASLISYFIAGYNYCNHHP